MALLFRNKVIIYTHMVHAPEHYRWRVYLYMHPKSLPPKFMNMDA
ncbi:hypothetical protein GTCCBUS3UF5_37020 [Geobacillus thermoleovorans CCB_US3_UF5]|uniref:Uncharacterized protein n=1 Tax=Geobacillus thermoleovorans CCB_US3_UF5 TaxID=1111068 RepID=A0ABN4A5R1_GEOTH|nr:hypothetical protein GTCCBUS3UF5_37020 [Geobacillus thermoleovorans CCB_US3_UF5]